jgi:opine dehydrogenase
MQKVAVLGGGNGAHAAAADLSLRGFSVQMYEDPRFAGQMEQVFKTKQIRLSGAAGEGTANLFMVTTDLAEAICGVEYILLAVPAFAHRAYAEKLAAVIRPGQTVLLLPGTFGSLILWHAFQKAGVQGVTVAETHTLPYAARLTGPADVMVMGQFSPLKLGVLPAKNTAAAAEALRAFYPALEPCESVVACGLSSLNPIIHVPGCILNAGRIEYAKGEFYFYTEGFTSCVVRATEAVDAERIALLKAFGYASDIVAHGIGSRVQTDDLHTAVAGNPSFAGIKGPADTKNRYYSEDIPYGLALWAKLARHVGVPTPMMDSMVNLGSVILEADCWQAGHSLEDLGIEAMDLPRLHTYLSAGR